MNKSKKMNWLCVKCQTNLWGGLIWTIGNFKKQKLYCQKHYKEVKK